MEIRKVKFSVSSGVGEVGGKAGTVSGEYMIPDKPKAILTLAHGVEVRNVFRDDVLGPSLPREKALANAPKRNAEGFLVPAVLE